MAMQKRTIVKASRFLEDYRGRKSLNHYQYLNTEIYPSWTTLKRYGLIQLTEVAIWAHGEGEEMEVNIYAVNDHAIIK